MKMLKNFFIGISISVILILCLEYIFRVAYKIFDLETCRRIVFNSFISLREEALIKVEFDRRKMEIIKNFKPPPGLETQGLCVGITPKFLHLAIPFHVRINSHGFRGKDFSTKKPSGTFRIICMGDSWTFGQCVEEDKVYCHVLENILKSRHPEERIEAINAGISGYASMSGLNLLKNEILEFSPDLIIASYSLNDYQYGVYSMKRFRFLPLWIIKLNMFLLTRSKLFGGMDCALKSLTSLTNKEKKKVLQGEFSVAQYVSNMEKFIDTARAANVPVILFTTPLPFRYWESYQEYLDALKALAIRKNVPLLDVKKIFNSYPCNNMTFEERTPFWIAESVWLAGKEDFLKVAENICLYVDYAHPNETGHMLIASSLADMVEEYLQKNNR